MTKHTNYPHTAYLSFGTNMGDREEQLKQALACLEKYDGIYIHALSSIYETAPVGYTDQASFLNMAACVRTAKSPLELLSAMQQIENELGRKRTIRWGPRTMDIDLLLYDDLHIEHPDLTIPHPRMLERAFVLVPLADLWENETELQAWDLYRKQLEIVDGKEGIRLWKRHK